MMCVMNLLSLEPSQARNDLEGLLWKKFIFSVHRVSQCYVKESKHVRSFSWLDFHQKHWPELWL